MPGNRHRNTRKGKETDLFNRPRTLIEWVLRLLPSGMYHYFFLPSIVRSSNLRQPSLLFDGQRIADNATAADLDLEDGDSLEVLLERKSDI